MGQSAAIRLFAAIFAASLLLSATLAYQASRTMIFAFALTPAAMSTLVTRIQIVRAVGLAIALVLMALLCLARSRSARSALAMRWVMGVVTSIAFLRGAGLIHALPRHDTAIIVVSSLQLALEAFAILLLYGEDATEWFQTRRPHAYDQGAFARSAANAAFEPASARATRRPSADFGRRT